jgi:hypothetical protein
MKPTSPDPEPSKSQEATPFFDSDISQWRLLLTVVAAVLFLSFNLNLFFLKQNRALMLQARQQSEQLAQIGQLKQSLKALIEEVAMFAQKHPEAGEILRQRGITVTMQPAPGAPTSPLTINPGLPAK